MSEGEALVKLAGSRDAILMVGHLLEYHSAVLRLRQLIDSGELGEFQLDEPFRRQSLHFLECIATRKQPLTDGVSGLRVLKVLDAAERSLSESGLPITLWNRDKPSRSNG